MCNFNRKDLYSFLFGLLVYSLHQFHFPMLSILISLLCFNHVLVCLLWANRPLFCIRWISVSSVILPFIREPIFFLHPNLLLHHQVHGSPVLIYITAWFCCVIYQSLIEIIHSLLIKSFISINHVQFLLNNLTFWLCEAPKLMKNIKKDWLVYYYYILQFYFVFWLLLIAGSPFDFLK